MLREKKFKGNVDVNYAEGPDSGLPLLLIHGTLNRWQTFLRIIPSILPRWHVYAMDFRGHGRSGRGENYGFNFFYRDTEQFIEQNIKKHTVVFGHSLGGRVALKLAAERPELVMGIILGDSSLNEPEPSSRLGEYFGGILPLIEADNSVNCLYRRLKDSASDQFDPVQTINRAKTMSQVDPEFIRYLVKYGGDLESPYGHFTGYHPEEHLKKVKCPVLILQAEKGMLSDEQVLKAQNILPESYSVKLKDMPHEFLSKGTVPVVDAVNAFLELLI